MSGSTISSSAINPVDENGNPIFIAKGNAGNITIFANNTIKLSGLPEKSQEETALSSINSNTLSDGNAGLVNVTAKNIEVLGSVISSRFKAYHNNNGILISNKGGLGTVNINASEYIRLYAFSPLDWSGVSANTITLMTKYLDLKGGNISSSAFQYQDYAYNMSLDNIFDYNNPVLLNGKAGDIKIYASESILMDSMFKSAISDEIRNQTPSHIYSDTSNNENAGNIYIKTKEMTLINSQISSLSNILYRYTIDEIDGYRYQTGQVETIGKAGEIKIDASVFVKLDSDAIEAINLPFVRSFIDTSTDTSGDAGVIRINTKNLELTGGSFISSKAHFHALYDINDINNGKGSNSSLSYESNSGNAGKVFINADNILLRGNITLLDDVYSDNYSFALISSSTSSSLAAAGEVNVVANKISLYDKAIISSASTTEISSGKTGDVNIKTQELMMEGGKISIENEALLSDANLQELTSTTNKIGNINLDARNISMNHAQITSASTENIPSGNINVDVSHALEMKNNSFINTTSNTGNGGHINFHGGEFTYLQDSGFITTVKGELGNGGNISANTKVLVIDTGIIQANAVSGNGGTIQLALEALIPSRNTLIQGGQPVAWNTSPTNINLIQAASEHGVSGTVNNSAPQLNLSGVLANIINTTVDNNLISQDYCTLGQGSSLSKKGRGALPMRPKDFQSF
jgi:large exoprotein involved in heme utilization and adhesion